MLYLSLGRCFDPRNLRRSGVTVVEDWCCFDLEEEEFVRLPLSLLSRRDGGDAISLSPRRCRDALRLLNLRRLNDGIMIYMLSIQSTER